MDLDEAEWVRRGLEGDLEALEMLYRLHQTMVYSVGLAVCGNAADADDVVQETFLRAFDRLNQWRGESRFGTWLYSVALRTAQNWKSRFALRKVLVPARHAPVEDDRRELLLAAVADLPEQQRIILTLKHIRGLGIREIAEIQGVAEGTVKASLHHAVQALMRRLA